MSDNRVLIIGGGLAGWRAAKAAAEGGAHVTLVSNGAGNSPHIHALCCPILEEDSAELYARDTLANGGFDADPILVETMCRESLKLRDEYDFDASVIRSLGSSVPRCVSIRHSIGALAIAGIRSSLQGLVEEHRYTLTASALAEIHAREPSLKIILATGGWCGKYAFSTNPSYLRGDGLAMADALGGALRDVDEDHVQCEPTVRLEGQMRGVPVITTLLYEGARLLDPEGRELLPQGILRKSVISKAIRQAGGYAFYDLSRVPEEKITECNMDPAERMLKVAPAPHSSMGGVVIDSRCHVLDSASKPVPGLYACGEVTAGIHGLDRLGGNGGTAAMVFGSIAGETAASERIN